MNRPASLVAAFLLGIAVAIPATHYALQGAHLIAVDASPNGRERIESYAPNHFERWTHRSGYSMPGYARLYDIATAQTVADSPIFELSDSGHVVWTRDHVFIGTATYDRRSRTWTVQR